MKPTVLTHYDIFSVEPLKRAPLGGFCWVLLISLILNADMLFSSVLRLLLLAGCESDLAGGGGVGGGDSWSQRGPRVHRGGHIRRDQTVRSGRRRLQVRHQRVPGIQVHVLRRSHTLKQGTSSTLVLRWSHLSITGTDLI